MKNIGQIIKKEMDKIFKFPRMIFSTLLLPGLLIFGIYAFMGSSLSSTIGEQEEYESLVYIINVPTSFEIFLEENVKDNKNLLINYEISDKSFEEYRNQVKTGTIDLVIEFEDGFDEKLVNNQKPTLTMYYNKTRLQSESSAGKLQSVLDIYKNEELAKKGWHTDIFEFDPQGNIADENKSGGQVLAMLLPMFIMTFVFAGALSVGSDAIAGEKERGTLATLLMAPIKRTNIIIAKNISTALIAIMSALSSFIGVLASLPFAKSLFAIGGSTTYSIYAYIQLFIVLIVLGMLSASLIMIASTFAKTTKEASSYAMPIYIVAILVSTLSMFSLETPKELLLYVTPIYNISLGLRGIFSFDITSTQFLLLIGSNLVYIVLINLLLFRMFRSEKVLFNR